MMDDRHIRAVDRPDATARDYLGDGVYVAFDGYGIWLTAEDGISATDAIYFEPVVYKALQRFMERLKERLDSLTGQPVNTPPEPPG